MEFYNVTDDSNYSFQFSYSDHTYDGSKCCRRSIVANIMGSFFTILIAIISLIGNVAVVAASNWDNTLREQTGNLFVACLSTIDILTAIIIMIPSAISVAAEYWPFGSALCKVNATFNYMFSCSSMLTIAAISFDRAVAVVYPLQYNLKITTKVTTRLCALIFCIGFPVGLVGGLPDWTSYNYGEAVCAAEYTLNSHAVYYSYNICCFFCFYTPSAVIGVCNILIIVKAIKLRKSKKLLFVRRNDKHFTVRESVQNDIHMMKTVKSMVAVVIIFFACYSPYCIGKLVKVNYGMDIPQWFNYLSTICVFMASATNPFIYAIFRKDYRHAFKRLPRVLKQKLEQLFA